MNDNRLTFHKVSHSYGAVQVLKELSLEVSSGEVIVLVGPSGCGKTTILNLLSGHIEPTSGSIQRTGNIRTIYQQDGLFPWLTVAENISLGLRSVSNAVQKQIELDELLELIRMTEFANHYPHELSGGMRQRVELARVLAGDSDILLMDEPFSALDYQARLRMRYELVRLLEKRPRTVVFVTHDIEEAAQLADRVFVLTNRPTSICRELPITTKKPRGLTDASVIKAMEEIFRELGLANISDSVNL